MAVVVLIYILFGCFGVLIVDIGYIIVGIAEAIRVHHHDSSGIHVRILRSSGATRFNVVRSHMLYMTPRQPHIPWYIDWQYKHKQTLAAGI